MEGMKKKRNKIDEIIKLISISVIFIGCHPKENIVQATYKYIEPVYGEIKLAPVEDTLRFPLNEHTYKRIEALNLFKDHSTVYLAFYDRGSKSLNIYDFYSSRLIKRTSLYSWIKKKKLDKASLFVKNFDSIYITTMSSLYLLDSSGVIKKKMEYPEDLSRRPYITSTAPAIFKGDMMYMMVKPSINDKSLEAQRQWRVLYEFDINNEKKTRYYPLPDIYQNNFWGYAFVDYGYCVNDKGNFVFSFAADPNIYETNLSNYHVAYFGRSKFQKGDISPVSKELLQKEDGYKVYSLRDSYGEILFDPYRKRYLRLAKQKMTEADFQSHTVRKKRSIIVFDENFKLIGESPLDTDLSFDFTLFLDDGSIYTMAKTNDENVLYFVRLVYNDEQNARVSLAHSKMLKNEK